MGFGMALGGAAKGLESAENALARNKALALQEQGILGDQKLRERALGIQEKQLERSAQNDLTSQANSIISEELKVVSEVIKAGREAGHSPEQIQAAIEPLMADIEELAPTIGRDPGRIRNMVGATLNAPVAEATGDPKLEAATRKEFAALSKDFRDVRDAFSRVKASAKKPSAAGDLALIFNYMKILDPGSTVREGEFANAANAASVPQRVRNMYNSVAKGERLNTETRADFVDRAEMLFNAQQNQHKKLAEQFTALAKRQKLNPENVVTDFTPFADDAEAGVLRVPTPPPSLAGRVLQYNPATALWRDKTSMELFNQNGEPVATQ